MKQGWHSESIEDLCEVEYGTRVVRKRDAGTIYPVYGGGGATFSMDVYNREDRMVIARFAMSKKCVRFVDGKFFLNDSGLTISPLDGNTFDQDFLNYHILSLNDEIYSLARGTAQKNLNVDAFKKVKLSYPTSLEEQKQIVAKLDQCFEAIDKAKANAAKNLENAKELFQSKLNNIFSQKGEGWVEKKLLDVCSLKSGTTIAKSLEKGFGDIAYIKVADMNIEENLFSITTSSRYLDFKDINERNIFPIGTVIFPKRGGAIATNKKRITNIPICADLNTMGAIASDQIAPEYLHYYFLGFNLLDIANGTTILQINNYSFDNLKISLPIEYERQKDIVNLLSKLKEQTQSLESKYQQELNSLEELKKSILQKAFEGEL